MLNKSIRKRLKNIVFCFISCLFLIVLIILIGRYRLWISTIPATEEVVEMYKEAEKTLIAFNNDSTIPDNIMLRIMRNDEQNELGMSIAGKFVKGIGNFNVIVINEKVVQNKELLYFVLLHELVHASSDDDFLSKREGELMTILTTEEILKNVVSKAIDKDKLLYLRKFTVVDYEEALEFAEKLEETIDVQIFIYNYVNKEKNKTIIQE